MVRRAFKAGTWYPDGARRCSERIDMLLHAAQLPATAPESPLGGVAPHAGWDFCGPTAAHTFAYLTPAQPDTVVVFGADHYGLRHPVLMAVGTWQTPVGDAEIDAELAEVLLRAGAGLHDDPRAHGMEHSIEILMPFVRHRFPDARVLPIIAPPRSGPAEVGAAVAEACHRLGRKAIFVGSTDLTHYGAAYGFAPCPRGEDPVAWVRETNDARIMERVAAMDAEGVLHEAQVSRSACGAGAIAATIAAVAQMGASAGTILHYTTSHDVSPLGPPTQFVGYGAVGYA